jgi:hypothetical protein
VTNLGDQPLVFSTNSTYTVNFQENGGDANPCGSSTSLSAGTVCDVSVNFTPQSVGSLSAGITVTNNTLNVAGSTQQVSVSGTSFNPGDTTATTVSVNPSSVTAGQTVTITATVSDTTAGHTSIIPTGTVRSTSVTLNNGNPVTLSGGTATLSGVTLSGVGSHTITANYAGVSGSYFASSNTATVSVTPDFTLNVSSSSSASITVSAGGTGSYVLLVSPSGGSTFTSAVTFRVSGLPAGATATFTPSTLPAGSGASNVTLTIQLTGQTAALHRNTPLRHGLPLVMAGALLLPFGGRVYRAAGKRGLHAFLLVLVLAGAGAMVGLTSCGSSNSGYLATNQKTYAVTVTATSGSTSHSTTVNLTVQ